MAKKIISIRLDEEIINYLSVVSFKYGFHHKLSSSLPNITKTIEQIISEHEHNNNKDVKNDE